MDNPTQLPADDPRPGQRPSDRPKRPERPDRDRPGEQPTHPIEEPPDDDLPTAEPKE